MQANTLNKAFDAFENWLVESGMLDQLTSLVANTTAIRSVLMAAGGGVLVSGIKDADVQQMVIGSLVTMITGSLTMFITHVRDRHAKALQSAIGVKQDGFIGPNTNNAVVAAVNQPPPPTPITLP